MLINSILVMSGLLVMLLQPIIRLPISQEESWLIGLVLIIPNTFLLIRKYFKTTPKYKTKIP